MDRAKKLIYQTPDGKALKATAIDKFFRDVVSRQTGTSEDAKGNQVVVYDPLNPLQGTGLKPGKGSPICHKCGLDAAKAVKPYMDYRGPSKNPLITIIFDSVNKDEDRYGYLAADGASAWLRNVVILPMAKRLGFDIEDIRWAPLTRCANLDKSRPVNYRVKGGWCRLHLIQDLMHHPPRLIMPVGSVALGALSHKSNAQEWSGRLLTWRGWPDDWLTDPKFSRPRENPVIADGGTIIGHPLFGAPPDVRVPMVPVQAPYLVLAAQNKEAKKRFISHVERALKLAINGAPAPRYSRPWYRITQDIDEIESTLRELLDNPGTVVAYDTETTGLIPWVSDAAIVFMMFRWVDPASGKPRSIGFPWDFESIYPEHPNRVRPYIKRLRPLVLKVLAQSAVIGHNLTFDILYTFAKLHAPSLEKYSPGSTDYNKRRDAMLCALADAAKADTWHMAYIYRQQPGSRGLEAIVYDYAEDLAGYEEDMTILIDLHHNAMHPKAGMGGHYANCPPDEWKSHLEPYVMGDVEATYACQQELEQRLARTNQEYEPGAGLSADDVVAFPLASTKTRGAFRDFTPPGRGWAYSNVMAPAARLLMKLMGRGMFVSLKALKHLEAAYHKQLDDARKKIEAIDPSVIDWCRHNKAINADWELNLESKSQLRDVLFTKMGLNIQRLTQAGRQHYGDDPAEWDQRIARQFENSHDWKMATRERRADMVDGEKLKHAALDKFTLNKLAVDYPQVRPLQDYRRVFKMYTAYVKSMQSDHLRVDLPVDFDESIIDRDPYFGGLIHSQFMQTTTRSGRLSSKDPNLQNLPRKGDVKTMFVSRFGARGCLLNADLSQIELRLMASVSGDPTMIKAYREGLDLHTLTASRIFNLPYDTFSKEHFAELQRKGHDKEAKDLNEKRTVAKCVDENTIVEVNGRLTRISSVHLGREADTFYDAGSDLFVRAPLGKVKVNKFYCNGTAERMLVVSRHGIVACSRQHKFLTDDGNLVEAQALKRGDVLATVTPLAHTEHGAPPRITFNPFGLDHPAGNENYSVVIDSNFAYLLGLFYGDGAASENLVGICTGGTSDYFSWQDKIAGMAERAGLKPQIERTLWASEIDGPKVIKSGPNAGKKIHGACGRVTLGSRRVADLFIRLGAVDAVTRKRTHRLPDWLLNANYETKVSFVAGMIDSDGSVPRNGVASIIAKRWLPMQDVSVLLRSIGITHSIEPSWNKTYKRYYFRINITVRDSWKHFNGRLQTHKAEKLKEPKFVYKNEHPNTVQAIIGIGSGLLLDINVNTQDHVYCCNGIACKNTSNFLTGYGGGAFGLSNVLANQSIYKTIEFCESIIDRFFESYPVLRRHIQLYKQFIADTGRAVSIFGRVRFFEEMYSNDEEARAKALRAGYNHIIQSTASDMLLLAMTAIEEMMREEDLESILVSTVHDSMLADCVRKELPQVYKIVTLVLNNFKALLCSLFGDDYDTSWMLTDFAGDCEAGRSYGSLKSVIGEDVDWDKLLDE